MTTRCEMCLGKKTVLALGGLVKECPACKGVGHVKVDDNKDKGKR